jgi:threonine dehydrogenase-like Zn-dependent dehydrogenase
MSEAEASGQRGNLCVLFDEGRSVLGRRRIPTPDSTQVLIKIEAAMITSCVPPRRTTPAPECASCGKATRSRALLPCDNICGVIVGVGSSVDARAFRINQRVVVEPFKYCGCCFFCDRGQTNLCESGETVAQSCGAGLQEYIAVDCRIAHTVHEDVPRKPVVLTAVTAVVSSALSKACILPGDSVLVVGSDIHALVGISFVRCLGAEYICVVGRPGDRATNSAVACGARDFVAWDDASDAHAEGVQQAIQQATDGRGFDVVFCPVLSSALSDAVPEHKATRDTVMEEAGDDDSPGGEAGAPRPWDAAERARECMRAQRSLTLAMRSVRKGGSVVRCYPFPCATAACVPGCCEEGHPCSSSPEHDIFLASHSRSPSGSPGRSDTSGGLAEESRPGDISRGAGRRGVDAHGEEYTRRLAMEEDAGDGGAGTRAGAGAGLGTAGGGASGGGGEGGGRPRVDEGGVDREAQAQEQLLEQCLASNVRFIGVRGFSSTLFVQGLRWIEAHLLDLTPLLLVTLACVLSIGASVYCWAASVSQKCCLVYCRAASVSRECFLIDCLTACVSRSAPLVFPPRARRSIVDDCNPHDVLFP